VSTPKKITRWRCPECGLDLTGKHYNLDEGRAKCTKTWHKAVPVEEVFVSVEALRSPETRGQIADALMATYRADEFGCRRRPADDHGEGCITSNHGIAEVAAERAVNEALRVMEKDAEMSPC